MIGRDNDEINLINSILVLFFFFFVISNSRSSHPEVFLKKDVLNISEKYWDDEQNCKMKVGDFIKSQLHCTCFSETFPKLTKNQFLRKRHEGYFLSSLVHLFPAPMLQESLSLKVSVSPDNASLNLMITFQRISLIFIRL